jgi:hypothetical protein
MEGRCVSLGSVNVLIRVVFDKGNPVLKISAVLKGCRKEISYSIDSISSFDVEDWASHNLPTGYTIESKPNLRIIRYSTAEDSYTFFPVIRMGLVNSIEVPLTLGEVANVDNDNWFIALVNAIAPAMNYFSSVLPSIISSDVEQQTTAEEKSKVLVEKLVDRVGMFLG